MANAMEGPNGGAATSSAGRPPRLPRWTRQEILILIEGKRVVEKRGRGRAGPGLGSAGPVEPKWAAVSAYCRRHGVNRGPVQCRKRWSNLAGDYKKIKEYERTKEGERESFWAMRNDMRREKRLPGFFDREVYDILDGGAVSREDIGREKGEEEREEEEEGEEKVFDSGRKTGEEGLFEEEQEEEEREERGERADVPPAAAEAQAVPAAAVVPISEKMSEPSQPEISEPGTSKDKTEKGSSSHEGQKRRRTEQAQQTTEQTETNLQTQILQVLERNSKLVAAQIEAQNMNLQLDRDQRKEQTNGLLGVLGKLADALEKIADKL